MSHKAITAKTSQVEAVGEINTPSHGRSSVFKIGKMLVIHQKAKSTGWKPFPMDEITAYSHQVLVEMGLSTRMINEMQIRFTFIKEGTQGEYGHDTPLGDSWSGLCATEWGYFGDITKPNNHTILVVTQDSDGTPRNRIQTLRTITHEIIHAAQKQQKRLRYTYFAKSGWRASFTAGRGKQTGFQKRVAPDLPRLLRPRMGVGGTRISDHHHVEDPFRRQH